MFKNQVKGVNRNHELHDLSITLKVNGSLMNMENMGKMPNMLLFLMQLLMDESTKKIKREESKKIGGVIE